MFGDIETDRGLMKAAAGLRGAAARDALSHAMIVTGGEKEKIFKLSQFAAAALECRSADNRPCGICPDCRKILKNIHPDVITVRDDDHQMISADVIRSVRADAWITPNEGSRKVYIFPDCALLTERDQNILLKLVEEGPPYAAFLFCADNISVILRTLRSRCVEVRVSQDAGSDLLSRDGDINQINHHADSEAARETGIELCRRIVKRRGSVAELAARLEKKRVTRETLADILYACHEILAAALLLSYHRAPRNLYQESAGFFAENLTPKQIARAEEIVRKYHGECARQTGVNHILGALASELEELR